MLQESAFPETRNDDDDVHYRCVIGAQSNPGKFDIEQKCTHFLFFNNYIIVLSVCLDGWMDRCVCQGVCFHVRVSVCARVRVCMHVCVVRAYDTS